MIKRLRLWLWERRLVHARTVRSGIEREFCREIARAQQDLDHCETMTSRARMDLVRRRADRSMRTRRAAAR